jgi:hypothetical protein
MPVPDDTAAVLAEIRDRNEGRIRFYAYTEYTVEHDAAEGDVRRLLAALDSALAPHAPRPDRVLGSSCFTHRTTLSTMIPVPGCGDCVQDRQREVCPECRDEFGDPVLFQDCRARSAVLAALTGKENADGR